MAFLAGGGVLILSSALVATPAGASADHALIARMAGGHRASGISGVQSRSTAKSGWWGSYGNIVSPSIGMRNSVLPYATNFGCSGYFSSGSPLMMQCRAVAPDYFGTPIVIRQGYFTLADHGFGESKFVEYHGIDTHSVMVVLNQGVLTVDGANVYKIDIECLNPTLCPQLEDVRVIVSLSKVFRTSAGIEVATPDGRMVGVVTAYCNYLDSQNQPVKETICPSWVNSQLAAF